MKHTIGRIKSPVLQVALILILTAVILLAIIEATSFVHTDSGVQSLIAQYGYVGILVMAIIAGMNIFVPIPAATFTPIFAAAGLWMPLIVLMLIIGTTIADIAGYTIGRLGKEFTSEHYPRTYARIFSLNERNHALLLPFIFIYSAFVPFPNEAFLIPLALVGVRLRTFILPLILGTTVNQILFAYGIQNIFEALF